MSTYRCRQLRRHKAFHPCSRFRLISFAVALSVILALLPAVAKSKQVTKAFCVRLEKIGPPPGFWSGQIAAVQWLDAVVISETENGKVGDHLRFGVYVVHGSKFSDSTEPKLNSLIFHPGAAITLRDAKDCKFAGSEGYVYDPSCLTKGCSKKR